MPRDGRTRPRPVRDVSRSRCAPRRRAGRRERSSRCRLRRPDPGNRRGQCRPIRGAARRPHRQHAGRRASVLPAEGRQRALRRADQRVGGAPGRAHPGPDSIRRGDTGRAAGHDRRTGVSPARSGPAQADGRVDGGPLRDRSPRSSDWTGRPDSRAGASARAADADRNAYRARTLPWRCPVTDRAKPLYMIGVVADMLNVHPQTLRFYEKKGLVRPSRTVGRTRMYSAEDVDELSRLLRLTRDLGVNLAGIEVILKMRRRMMEMQKQIEDLVTYLREDGGETSGSGRPQAPREALVRAASGHLKPVDLF